VDTLIQEGNIMPKRMIWL